MGQVLYLLWNQSLQCLLLYKSIRTLQWDLQLKHIFIKEELISKVNSQCIHPLRLVLSDIMQDSQLWRKEKYDIKWWRIDWGFRLRDPLGKMRIDFVQWCFKFRVKVWARLLILMRFQISQFTSSLQVWLGLEDFRLSFKWPVLASLQPDLVSLLFEV